MKNNTAGKYQGFSLSLAIVDALPVVIYGISGIIASKKISSILLLIGVILSLVGGISKVCWKAIIALKKKDFSLLTKLFHILMPSGFLLMLFSFATSHAKWFLLIKALVSMPSLLFLIFGVLGIVLMTIFAFKLPKNSAKANWIEQITNTVAQAMFLVALVLA